MNRIAALAVVALLPLTGCVPDASVGAGRRLYAENGCASCHGPEGHGDGPVGRTLMPRPRNFADDAAYVNGRTPEAIARTLSTGIDRNGAKMPSFAHLTDRERLSLAAYVLSLHDTPTQGASR